MKKLLILFFLLPFALMAQKVNGVYTRAELTAQRPLQCSACLVQEGDSVWLFVRKNGSTAVAGPDVIVTTFGSIKLHKTKLAGAINLGSANYYTKADVADLLSTRLKKASTLNHNAVPLYDGYNNEVQSSLLNQDGGNMGINKIFPEYRLDVSGVIHSDNALWVKDRPVATTLTNYVALYRGDGNIGQYLGRGYGLSDPFALYLGGGHRFYSRSNGPNFGTLTLSIDTTSRVGIRRTTPSYGLDVAGTMGTDSSTHLAVVTGNVGINTTAPDTKLHVVSADNAWGIAASAPSGRIRMSGYITGNSSPTIQFVNSSGGAYSIGTIDAESQYFKISGTTQMLLNSSGNVGVGTTLPLAKLHVNGGGDTRIRVGNESQQWSMAVGQYGTGNFTLLQEDVAIRLFVSASDGKVGIGTPTPTSQLQVVGIPEYASNAAAVTAGLTAGAFYHTGGTLKVVIP